MTTDPRFPGDETEMMQAQAVKRLAADVDEVALSDGYGNHLRPGALPLLDALARSLVTAGFTIHDCAGRAPGGGVCLTPLTTQDGIVITWTQHDAAETELAWEASQEVQTTMNRDLACIAVVLGFEVEPFGSAGARRVTGLAGPQS